MPCPHIFKILIRHCWIPLKKILGPKNFPPSLPLVRIAKKRIFWQKILFFRVIQENFFNHLKCIEGTWVHAQKFFQNFLLPWWGGGRTDKRKIEIATAPNLREVHKISFRRNAHLENNYFLKIFWNFFEWWVKLKNQKNCVFCVYVWNHGFYTKIDNEQHFCSL